MATPKSHAQEEDIISHYGSLSGETFASRRSRRDCSLRMNSIDVLAKSLREYDLKQDNGEILDRNKLDAESLSRGRFNRRFHHYRLLVVIMGGISVGLMLLLRYNLTISILMMVNQTHLYLEEHPNRTVEDFLADGYSLGGEFNWNNEIVAIILSWYMFTYTLPQMPMSRLSAKVGSRLSTPVWLSLCAISSLLTPIVAYWGWQWVVVLRLLNGLGASAILPMMLNLIEGWMRYDEISFGLSVGQGTSAVLVTFTPLITGYLTEIHWKWSFLVPGAVTLVFCLVWLLLISDSPETNKFISAQELMYLLEVDNKTAPTDKEEEEEGQAKKVVTTQQDEDSHRPDSWTQIFKVPSFYAYIMMWGFYCSAFSGFSFILPTYMRQFLKIKVSQNGLYCFIIQIGCIFSVLWPHPLLRLLQRVGLSLTHARIVAHGLLCSMVGATFFYVGTFHEYQIPMLFVNRCFHMGNDIIVTGSLMSNYAKAGMSSLAFSIVNTVGNLSVVVSSTFFGWVLDYTAQSRGGWLVIYYAFGFYQVAMFTMFALFVNSDPIKFKNKRHQSKAAPHYDIEGKKEAAHEDKKRTERRLNNYDDLKSAAASDEPREKDAAKND